MYIRVLPRDLFNEANLLKCYGRLWLLVEGNPDAGFDEEYVDSFEIGQDENDGSISVVNLTFILHGETCRLHRPMNSRDAWPLYVTTADEEEFPVFDDKGNLSPDMEALIRKT